MSIDKEKISLEKISIENYMGFKKKQTLTFAQTNGELGSGLTVIVGANNSGKSNILDALGIRTFMSSDFEDRLHSNAQLEIVHYYSNSLPVISVANKKLIAKEKSWPIDASKVRFLSAHRTFRSCIIGSEHEFINDNTNIDIQSLSYMDVRNSSEKENTVFLEIDKNPYKKTEINNLIKQILPNFYDWKVDYESETICYMPNQKISHNSDFVGNGVKSIILLCTFLVISNKDQILIIDEPESALHPSAQKKLAKVLAREAANRQIIICTHSPYFVNWGDFLNGAEFIRTNQNELGECIVSNLSKETGQTKKTKTYYDFIKTNHNSYMKPQLLDIVAKEIFFSNNILLVEGQEDVGIIRKWLEEEYEHLNFEIFGYGVGGFDNFKYFLEMAKDLGIKKIGVLADKIGDDETKKMNFDKLTNEYKDKDYRFKELPTEDIRDKEAVGGREAKAGIFDSSGELKQEHDKEFREIMDEFIKYFDKPAIT